MAKFEIYSAYYDGRDISEELIGVTDSQNLDSLIAHIKKCGFIGKDGNYTRRLNCFDYHGDHSHCISIVPHEEPRLLTSEEDWLDVAEPYDNNFTEIEPGYYRYTRDPWDDDWPGDESND